MQQQLSFVDRAKPHVRLKVDAELGELEARMGVDPRKVSKCRCVGVENPDFRVSTHRRQRGLDLLGGYSIFRVQLSTHSLSLGHI
jgi:hypothetical protein